ncbi:TetR/AcrR family transcriptional regulator [Chitinibacter tainanensis]|uniref:TetR/AcrR family transcriptional regulator n=1 Tax=Chitinibacter tainanensis TaxID=230667 RepID=UPI0023526594|nr:TetR/AcrR family transcriptional regulator [Chitinibacter tainanensis]
MNTPAISKSSENKRQQIMAGAREVFMDSGYAAASMERIAKTAGVSKGTLYNYFDSKETLFVALIQSECCKEGTPPPPAEFSNAPPAPILTLIGQQWLQGLIEMKQRTFFRIVLAEVMQFPELGQALEASGPAVAMSNLSRYLAHLDQSGVLRIPDPLLAAEQFFALCDAGIVRQMQLSVAEPTLEKINYRVEHAVRVFLAGYTPQV